MNGEDLAQECSLPVGDTHRDRQSGGHELVNGEEDFRGGYSMAEKYLLKAGIIDKKYYASDSGSWILSDSVADHFTLVADQFMPALIDYIDTALERLEESTITVSSKLTPDSLNTYLTLA